MPADTATPDAVVDRLYAAYNARDVEAAAALYADDGWHEEANAGRRRTGRAAVADGLAGFFRMMPDAAWQERERIRAGGSVAVVYTLRGSFRADVGPFKATGQPVELAGLHVVELDGDRIRGTRDFWDMAAFVRQIA